MKTRVNSLGGNILFNSSINQGTEISVEVLMNKIIAFKEDLKDKVAQMSKEVKENQTT